LIPGTAVNVALARFDEEGDCAAATFPVVSVAGEPQHAPPAPDTNAASEAAPAIHHPTGYFMIALL